MQGEEIGEEELQKAQEQAQKSKMILTFQN